MIKLVDLLKEVSKDSYQLTDKVVEVRTAIQKFFNDNKKLLKTFVDNSDWSSYYDSAIKEFPNFEASKVVQAMGNQAMAENWYVKLPIPKLNTNTGAVNKPFLNKPFSQSLL